MTIAELRELDAPWPYYFLDRPLWLRVGIYKLPPGRLICTYRRR